MPRRAGQATVEMAAAELPARGRAPCREAVGPRPTATLGCMGNPAATRATSVAQYLANLPADRRAALQAVREVLSANLDGGYEEGMQYGMIGYYVPHSVYPAGYHCDRTQPLPFAGLASQKNHMSLYLMGLYTGQAEAGPMADNLRWFQAAWARTGKKLDMGKACIRFKKAEDLALDVLGEAVRRIPASRYIQMYESTFGAKGKPASVKKAAATAGKPAAKGARASNAASPKQPSAAATKKAGPKSAARKSPARKAHASNAPSRKAAASKAATRK